MRRVTTKTQDLTQRNRKNWGLASSAPLNLIFFTFVVNSSDFLYVINFSDAPVAESIKSEISFISNSHSCLLPTL